MQRAYAYLGCAGARTRFIYLQRQCFGQSVAWLTQLYCTWSTWQTEWQDSNMLLLMLATTFMGHERRDEQDTDEPHS